jgi:hypothetical protein
VLIPAFSFSVIALEPVIYDQCKSVTSRTTIRVAPPSRRKACSCNSAHTCALDRNASKRTDLRL